MVGGDSKGMHPEGFRLTRKASSPGGKLLQIPMDGQTLVTKQEISKMKVSLTDGCLPLLMMMNLFNSWNL